MFVGLFFLWPVLTIVARGLSVDAVTDVLGRASTRAVVWFTFWQAVVCSVLAVLTGLAPAYVLARYGFPGRRLLLALVTVPFVLPTVVVGAAFLALTPPSMHRTTAGVIVAHVWVNMAVVVRTIGTALSQLDPRLGDAAATLGASPSAVMRHVTLPLLRPAVVASASLVFLFCFTSFGIVRILGGPANRTIEVEIWRRTTQTLDLRAAAVLAVLQLLIVVTLVGWWNGAQARAGAPVTPRTRDVLRHPRTTRQRTLVAVVGATTALVVLAPLVVMVDRSFLVAGQHTFAAWRAVLGRPPSLPTGALPLVADPFGTVTTSLRIALVATFVAMVLAGSASVAIAASGRVGRALDTGLMLPLGASAVTVGFGLIITFDDPPLDLRGSWMMIPLGHALVAFPFAVRVMLPALRAIPPGLREAAATLGASPGRAWREVDLPVVRRALGAGAGFALAISLGEFGATSFLTRRGELTAPIAITRLLGRPSALNLAQAYALATMLAVLTFLLILLVDHLRGERSAAF
jgi:thiamine transport system permease protein